MAFFGKAGNILRQISQKHFNPEIAASKPSIFQMIRCMSSSKVFVGGLSYSTDDMSLREAFSNYGDVAEARVIQDRETGRSRGFGFVTYASEEAASAAIQALDGQELHGRTVRVNYANDRPQGGGGYGGGRGGYGGGGGGYGGGGGNYGGYGGGGGNYGGGGGNYGSGGGNYGDGGRGYSENTYGANTYGSQGSGGYNAPAGGGFAVGDNYTSPGAVPTSSDFGGYNASSGSSGVEPSGQFGNDASGDMGVASGGLNETAGGEFRDDDDTSGDFADRRG